MSQEFELLKKSAITEISDDLQTQFDSTANLLAVSVDNKLSEWEFDRALTESGDFDVGFTVTERQQTFLYNGEWYRWDGALPKTVPSGSTPQDEGGIGSGNWLSVGDAAVRQDLANPDKGAAMVARGVVAVDSIADLLALPSGQRKSGLRYLVKGYYSGSNIGGGEFYWNASADKSTADGGKVVDPDALGGFDGDANTRDTFLDTQGSGLGSGCFVLLSVPNQMNYGCVGDGSFDDSDAVQKAIDAQVTFIDKEHGITNSLYVYDSIDMSAATFLCDNQPITYLTVGKVSESTRQKKYGIPCLLNNPATTYVIDGMAAGSVGVCLISLQESRVEFHPSGVTGFDTGVELYSEGPGLSYTEFRDIRAINCRRHISFHTVDNGWITECLFLKLKTVNYDNFCHPDMDLSGEGVNYLHINVSEFHAVENITFVNPTLEGKWVTNHIEAVAGAASGWCMISPRFEVPGDYFRVVGRVANINLINPSNAHKVKNIIGDGRWQSISSRGLVAGNAPVILGGSMGDRTLQGIGLLNENFDFSDRDPSSFTPSDFKDFVWNISKSGFSAQGLVSAPESIPRLAIRFLQRKIEWGMESPLPERSTVGIQAERLYGPNLGVLTVDADELRPKSDGVSNLGRGSLRWANVYAASGVINTSDERSKQQIKPIDEAALRAWARVEYVQYKFNDAVEEKGEGARWHFGLIAQRVKEAFEEEGLDAFEYGLLCYDEWEEAPEVLEQVDEDGNVLVEATPYQPAGSRYGIRYEEALALECAYLRSRLS